MEAQCNERSYMGRACWMTSGSINQNIKLMATKSSDYQQLPSLEDLLSHHGYERKDLDVRYPPEMKLEIARLLDDWKMIVLAFLNRKKMTLEEITTTKSGEEWHCSMLGSRRKEKEPLS